MIRINLSILLGKKKMTQAELSRKTGIRPNTINALYHEYIKYMHRNDLDKICEALECDIAELLEYVPNKEKSTL